MHFFLGGMLHHDAEVKKEIEDQDSKMLSCEEDHLTLVQISRTSRPWAPPTPNPKPSSSVKRNKVKDKKGKVLRITFKHVTSDHAGKSVSTERASRAIDGLCSSGEAKSSAMIRAEEVQSNLEPEFPSFVKSMVRSHVASCYWMGIPVPFCKSCLPKNDATITLEDEWGKKSETKYLAHKTGLSAGWRQFSVDHKLLEGDVLVFHLVEPTKFKVYIIRLNDMTEVDGALGLLTLDAQTKHSDSVARKNTKRKHSKSLPLAIIPKKKKTGMHGSIPNLDLQAVYSENDSENVNSEVLGVSQSTTWFKEMIDYEHFNSLVKESVIDSELSEDIRAKYYKLCCSQNEFLHNHLTEGINSQLISGIISEIVNIADALSACSLSTSRDEFSSWGKTLKAFELLGMNVGFLNDRLQKLVRLAFESEGAMDRMKYIEAKTNRARTEEEIRSLEAKLVGLKEASEMFAADIETLKLKGERYELKFQEEVTAPW